MQSYTILTYISMLAHQLNVFSVILRVCLSVLLAAIIGCERSSKRHSAGLRTFVLVSLAGTLAMLMDQYWIEQIGSGIPLITAAAVVGGAMVSGNSILFSSRSQIKGLTTSAALWGCGLLGVAAGAGCYALTLVAFLALVISLSLLPTVEKYLKDKSNHFEIHLELKNKGDLQDFIATIRKLGIQIADIESNPAYLTSGLSVFTVSLTVNSPQLKQYKKHSEIIDALRTLDYVSYIEEMM